MELLKTMNKILKIGIALIILTIPVFVYYLQDIHIVLVLFISAIYGGVITGLFQYFFEHRTYDPMILRGRDARRFEQNMDENTRKFREKQ